VNYESNSFITLDTTGRTLKLFHCNLGFRQVKVPIYKEPVDTAREYSTGPTSALSYKAIFSVKLLRKIGIFT